MFYFGGEVNNTWVSKKEILFSGTLKYHMFKNIYTQLFSVKKHFLLGLKMVSKLIFDRN